MKLNCFFVHLFRAQFVKCFSTASMEEISKIWLGKLPPDSPYVKPFRLFYVQNGVEKNWDLMKVHDSVSIILFNKPRNRLIFVKQFRPGKNDCFMEAKLMYN